MGRRSNSAAKLERSQGPLEPEFKSPSSLQPEFTMTRFVGIDVAKSELAFALGPEAPAQSVANDARGIRKLVGLLRRFGPPLIVV